MTVTPLFTDMAGNAPFTQYIFISHFSGVWKSEIKVPGWSSSWEGHFPRPPCVLGRERWSEGELSGLSCQALTAS